MDQVVNSPLVTVFMSAYNSEKYISAAIESILNQSFEDFELLIIDDGSTDNTLKIVQAFIDPRLRLLQNDRNYGVSFTRQRGLEEAQGKYLAILDSDDLASPDRLKLQVEYLRNHKTVALLGGQAMRRNGDSQTFMPTLVGKHREIAMYLTFKNIFINSTVILDRQKALDVGGYILNLCEDYDLAVRIANRYEVANLSEILVDYRQHEGNISIVNAPEMLRAEKHILAQIQNNLALTPNIEIHHALLKEDYHLFGEVQFLTFLNDLRQANLRTQRFAKKDVEKAIFNIWFQIIFLKKSPKALSFYFHASIFKPYLFSFRQLRKVFKISLKSMF